MSHKQLFAELTKIAAEKKAQGYGGGYGYSPYSTGRFGGRGGAPGMYMHQGRYGSSFGGPHPAFMPLMGRRMAETLPEEEFRRQQQQEFLNAPMRSADVGTGWQNSPEYAAMVQPARAEKSNLEKQLREIEEQAQAPDVEAKRLQAERAALGQQVNASPLARMHMTASQGGLSGALASPFTLLGGGDLFGRYSQAEAAERASTAKADLMRQTYAKQKADVQARLNKMQEQEQTGMTGVTQQTGEQRKFLRGQDEWQQQKGRESYEGRPQSMTGAATPKPTAPPAAIPTTPAPNVPIAQPPHPAAASPGAPPTGAPPPAAAAGKRQMPPIGQSAPLKFSSTVFPRMTMDRLAEGAGRTMFDRYMKLANAHIAIMGKESAATIVREAPAAPDPGVKPVKPAGPLKTQSYIGKKGPDLTRALNAGLTGRKTAASLALDHATRR